MRALASTHSVLYAIYYWIALEYLQLAVLCFVQCSSLSWFFIKLWFSTEWGSPVL